MKNLVIGTWNIGNSGFKVYKNRSKVNAINEILLDNNVDIFCVQNVNGMLSREMKEKLSESGYTLDHTLSNSLTVYGDVIKSTNIVIVRKSFITVSEISKLSSNIKSGLSKRELNKVFVKVLSEGRRYNIINTSLDKDYKLNSKQLGEVGMHVDLESINPTIIAGSLNTKMADVNMMECISNYLNRAKLKIVRTGKTYSKSNDSEQLDYIIIPNSFDIENVTVYTDYKKQADHFPVVAKLIYK